MIETSGHDPLCDKSDHYCVCDLIHEAEQRGRDEAMDMDPVRRREAYLHGQRDMLAKVNRDWLREVIVANLMDGDDGGTLTMRCSTLADQLADIISDALRGLGGSDE